MNTFIRLLAVLSVLNRSVYARPPVSFLVGSFVTDSTGVETKNGKRYVIYRVGEGQTLFSIARRYRLSVDQIKQANPDVGAAVRYAQVIRIPRPDAPVRQEAKKETKSTGQVIRKDEMMKPSVKPEAKVTAEKAERSETGKAKPTRTDEKRTASTKKAQPASEPDKAGIHVVKSGQTLYSLAVRYGVPQAELRKWNNLSSDNVLIGQALIVSERAYEDRLPAAPVAQKSAERSERSDRDERAEPPTTTERPERSTRPAVKPEPAAKPTPRTDVATKPESRSTATRPDVVRANPARPEPKPEPKDEKRDEKPVAKRTDETPADNRPANGPANRTEPAKDGAAEPEPEPPRAGNDAPLPTRGRRIATTGVAEMIDGADGSGKYLALHRTAPIGTLVLVRNAFNNQSVWVKVIGRLPDTGVNDKILVKLSQQAFAKLSPEDRRFRAEVSYIVR